MATRGAYIGRGFVRGLGMAYIYQDLDDTKQLFVRAMKRDETRYVPRSQVGFRK